MCFGFGNKVSRNRRLPSTRARARLSNRRVSILFCVLCFLKRELTARRNFKPPPPRLRLKLRVRIPVAAREEEDASHLRRPGETAPSDIHRNRGASRLTGKERPTRRAPCALSGVRTARPCSVHPARLRGVHPARLAACHRRVLQRAIGTSWTYNRHVLRRATSTSGGVQPARPCGVRSAPSGAIRRVQERAI